MTRAQAGGGVQRGEGTGLQTHFENKTNDVPMARMRGVRQERDQNALRSPERWERGGGYSPHGPGKVTSRWPSWAEFASSFLGNSGCQGWSRHPRPNPQIERSCQA